MATVGNNLSKIEKFKLTSCEKIKIGVVVASWNNKITDRLAEGAISALKESGILETNIQTYQVPGTFELPLGAQYLLDKNAVDGVICIGCVIQGETKHFDYVCQGATNGIMSIGLRYNKPVSFCVLTDENEQQSIDRSGGKHGNKGIECAVSCLKMIELKKGISSTDQKIGF
jgi:6,7-dimethyl-8-ribityllumazine synthase